MIPVNAAVAGTSQRPDMTDGTLLHVCVSSKKGVAKQEAPSVFVQVEYGMEGDAHAGDWHRQVSLLAHLDIESMRAKGLKLSPGAFGENLVIDGLDTDALGVGSRLRIGPVLLELTQIGKVCHTRCAIYYTTGDCIMPRTGLFARVLEGGALHSGLRVEVVHRIPRSTIQAAVITVADGCTMGAVVDTAGPAIAALVTGEFEARVAWTRTVPAEVDLIAEELKDLCDRRVDLVITCGGTGISGREVTLEATRKVIDREMSGLAEAVGEAWAPHALGAAPSRAFIGVRRETLIINLPGSRKAAAESLGAIRTLLPHAIKILRNQAAHSESDKGRLITLNSDADSELQAAALLQVR